MNIEYCRGCGSKLQNTNPNLPGYIPNELSESRHQVTCQRCYQIAHYGKIGSILPNPDQIRQSIIKAINISNLLVIVSDVSDLTGTLAIWKEKLEKQPYILVVNKSDLIPPQAKLNELAPYIHEYLAGLEFPAPRDFIITSGAKGRGIEVLLKVIRRETRPGDRIAMLGVTNVGKSSLIQQLMVSEGAAKHPTISKFPGTTLGLSNWSIIKSRNTVIDTPGMITTDRISDRLCPECATRLLATAKITSKLWGLHPGKGLIIGGLLGLEYRGEAPTVAISFAAPQVISHRTDNSRIQVLLNENPAWLSILCNQCKPRVIWHTESVTVFPGQDLAVAGLGWVSWRGQGGVLQMTLPQGIRWETRPALVGRR